MEARDDTCLDLRGTSTCYYSMAWSLFREVNTVLCARIESLGEKERDEVEAEMGI